MNDMIDISQAEIVNAPDVRQWPATAAITQVRFDGSVTRVAFTKQDGPGRWPDVIPKGWTGPLQYTLWLFRKINNQWVGSAFIQFWYGRDGSGSTNDPDVPSRYDRNWYYAARWSPLYGSGPIQPGESIGFMVTSGNQRDSYGPNSVQERSNVVLFPASDNATFAFPSQPAPTVPVPPTPPAPEPPPAVPIPPAEPVPPVGPPPNPAPPTVTELFAKLDALLASTARIEAALAKPAPAYKGVLFGYSVTLKPEVKS